MIAIWKKDYNIIIAEQSEKEWSYVQKNKDRINAMATSMVDSMELEVAPISTEILTNSLVQITRENVKRLKQVTQVEKNLLNSIDTKIEAYKIVGISKEDYMNSKPEERKEYNSKAKMEFDAQKFKAGILKDISGIGKNTNDSMLSAIDKADKINKRNEKFQLLKQHFDKTALPEKSTETDDKDVEILGDVAIDDNKLAKMRQWVEDNE